MRFLSDDERVLLADLVDRLSVVSARERVVRLAIEPPTLGQRCSPLAAPVDWLVCLYVEGEEELLWADPVLYDGLHRIWQHIQIQMP